MPKQSVQYYIDRFNTIPDEVKRYPGDKYICPIYPDDISEENLPLLVKASCEIEKMPIIAFRHESDPQNSGTWWLEPAYKAFIQLAESCPTLTKARISYIKPILHQKLTEQLEKNKKRLKEREELSKKDKSSADLAKSQSAAVEEKKGSGSEPSAHLLLSITPPPSRRELITDHPGAELGYDIVRLPSLS